jgi:hypothetical protein
MILFLCRQNSFLQEIESESRIGPISGNFHYHAVKVHNPNLLIWKHPFKVLYLISCQMVLPPDRKSGFCKLAQNLPDVVDVTTENSRPFLIVVLN